MAIDRLGSDGQRELKCAVYGNVKVHPSTHEAAVDHGLADLDEAESFHIGKYDSCGTATGSRSSYEFISTLRLL